MVNTTAVTATFNESVVGSSITTSNFVLKDSNNNTVTATVSYTDSKHTATLIPGAPLAATTTYTATISGVKDAAGNMMASPFTWSFTTRPPCRLSPARRPASGATGVVNTTTVTATFNESVVGSSITASNFVLKDPNNNTVAATVSYTDSNHTATLTPSAPLTASTKYTATISGVKDAAGNVMPRPFSWSFTITATVPTVTSQTPASGATGVVNTTAVTATFNESVLASSITASNFVLKDPSNNTVAATVSYTDSNHTATLTPSAPLTASTTYTATISGVKDAAGNVMPVPSAGRSRSPPRCPRSPAKTPASGATGVVNTTTVTATFNESVLGSSITTSNFVLKDSNNNTVSATVSYTDSNHTATLTPSAGLAAGVKYTATISGVKDSAGNLMPSPFTWSFTTAAASTTTSIWSSSAAPANPTDPESASIELGVKFYSDVSGYITGLKFYKGSTNTGTHVGDLWSSSGTLLATATFSNETASGWQQVNFSSPVAITAGTTYVASYHTNVGYYADDQNYFSSQYNSGQLHVPANGGVYSYGGAGTFPNQVWNKSNYWVDVVFSTVLPF